MGRKKKTHRVKQTSLLGALARETTHARRGSQKWEVPKKVLRRNLLKKLSRKKGTGSQAMARSPRNRRSHRGTLLAEDIPP